MIYLFLVSGVPWLTSATYPLVSSRSRFPPVALATLAAPVDDDNQGLHMAPFLGLPSDMTCLALFGHSCPALCVEVLRHQTVITMVLNAYCISML